jgi:hypothetical protein
MSLQDFDLNARIFIRSYFQTSVHHLSQLYKFYHPEATIIRGGVNRGPITQPSSLHVLGMDLPSGCTVTVANYSVVPVPPRISLISVDGTIESEGTVRGFCQHFCLGVDDSGRFWIISDVLSIFDDAFYANARTQESFRVGVHIRARPETVSVDYRPSQNHWKGPRGGGEQQSVERFRWSPEGFTAPELRQVDESGRRPPPDQVGARREVVAARDQGREGGRKKVEGEQEG